MLASEIGAAYLLEPGHARGIDLKNPLLGQGGVAAPIHKRCEATIAGAEGVFFQMTISRFGNPPPPAAPSSKVMLHFVCSARRPLLAQGGEPQLLLRDGWTAATQDVLLNLAGRRLW